LTLLLKVKSINTVLVDEDEICKVFSSVGGAKYPLAQTLCQVEKVDIGKINHTHSAEVNEMVSTYVKEVYKRLQ
tara:strand:- start:47 stop:268 length:222 start_codon:yes stop_codon:yes gene_type:complete